MKYSLPRVDNHGIQWRGIVLLYTYTESVEEKKLRERKENGEKSVAGMAGFELRVVGL